jgi:predicted class III extradiol MEMO1 family dioxygenase
MSTNAFDVIIEMLKEYGIVGLILCYSIFNHYDNLTYERENDKLILNKMSDIETKLTLVDYKLDVYNTRITKLESILYTYNDDDTIMYVKEENL